MYHGRRSTTFLTKACGTSIGIPSSSDKKSLRSSTSCNTTPSHLSDRSNEDEGGWVSGLSLPLAAVPLGAPAEVAPSAVAVVATGAELAESDPIVLCPPRMTPDLRGCLRRLRLLPVSPRSPPDPPVVPPSSHSTPPRPSSSSASFLSASSCASPIAASSFSILLGFHRRRRKCRVRR